MTSVPPSPGPESVADDRYDVFISYSRKDTEFAARLERALEAYKAPASLTRNRRQLRVFRDAQDLAGPDYAGSIQDNLSGSTRLLVICTPHSRQSPYVDQEIEWYLKVRDRTGVISLLLDGAPNNEVAADDPRRAFPAQLCKAHAIPLAADYRGFDVARHKPAKAPYENAWYTLLANIYGIDRNTVEERDRLRQRRERRIVSAIAGAVMLSLAGAAVFSWIQMRRAEEQRDVAVRGFARYLAMQSEEVRGTTPEAALLLAVEAARTTHDLNGTVTDEAALALRGALSESGGVRLGVGTSDASFSPEGRWLARVDREGTVTAWDLNEPDSQPARVTLPGIELSRHWVGPANRLAVLEKGGTRVGLLDLHELSRAPRWFNARQGLIHDLQFSADGAAMMALDGSPQIMVADLADDSLSPTLLQGHVSRRMGENTYGVRAATFSGTGRWIASAGYDNTVRLWDRSAAGPVSPQLLANGEAGWLRFSADDRWLIVSMKREGAEPLVPYALWYLDAPTPTPIKMDPTGLTSDTLADPGATKISLTVGDAFGSSAVVNLTSFTPLAFAPGERLIMNAAREVLVWKLDPAGARIERRVPGTLVAFGGDAQHFATVTSGGQNQMAQGMAVQEISLWNTEMPDATGRVEVAATLKGVGYSDAGHKLVVLTEDGELWSWNLEERDFESKPHRYRGAIGNSLLMSPDGRSAVVGYSYGESRWWNLVNPSLDPVRVSDVDEDVELEQKTSSGGMSGTPSGGLQQMMAFDAKSQRVAVSRNEGVAAIVDLEHPNRTPATFAVDKSGVSAVAFSPDGDIVAVGDRVSTIRLWRSGENKEPFAVLRVPAPQASASSISALAFSHSGKLLAAGGAFGTVGVWDVSAPVKEPLTLANHEDWVTTVAFSSDDQYLLVAAADGKASVVTVASPKTVRMLEGHAKVIRAAFTEDDKQVITAGMDATVRIWSMGDAVSEPRVLRGHTREITTFTLVPQRRLLATASEDGSLRVWDLAALDGPERITTLQVPVNVMTASHDGAWLALGDMGGGVELRRVDALDEAPLRFPPLGPPSRDAYVWALQFSPDDRWLAALKPGEGRLWRLRTEEVMQLACEAAGRNFEVDEWERSLSDVEYRLSCTQWGLGPRYLDYAHREAERGSFENALRLFNRAKVLTPELPFEARAEATRITVEGILRRGRSLARDGDSDAALAEFARVRQIDSASTFDPAREMERVKQAGALVPQAKKLALAGELEPAVAKYREALELDPGLSIDPVVDANKVYAPVVKEQGMALAREGRMEEAVALFERAAVLDPKMFWEETELTARNARAWALRQEADKLADQRDLQGAIAGYRAALAVDNRLGFDPEAEASKRVAERWMEEANDRLSHAYETQKYAELLGALDRFKQARKLDPKARVDAMRANELCWAAVQHHYAKQALEVCDAAVQSDADSWMARDSRGVARVLVGDTNGAIQDFEFYVQKSDRTDSVGQRKRWIASLKSGWRPQSFADLNAKQ